MIVSNALVKVGHCQVNYNHPPRTKKLAGGFAFAESRIDSAHLLRLNCCQSFELMAVFAINFESNGDGMTNISVRGLDSDLMASLKKQAGREGASVNAVVLRLIEQGLGKSLKRSIKQYDDLASLAGTWSQQDALEFDQTVASFAAVDSEIWVTVETVVSPNP
jgi:plasmid stability protein